MGNFSRDTFNALKQYVSVRLQQGVPLVDADWLELENIHRFELRAFLKWFVGNGVPETKDAFRIIAKDPPEADNFTVSAGDGGSDDPDVDPYQAAFNAGRCLVEGLDVFITQDIDFKDQPLHVEYDGPEIPIVDPTAPKIQIIPNTVDPVLVYLDVWEWEVGEDDDPEIVDDRIGIETSVRLKRDWAVRVREGTTVPTPSDIDEYVANHSYYALATISHGSGSPITETDITDERQTRLTLADTEKRLTNLDKLLVIPSFVASPDPQFDPPTASIGETITLFGKNFTVGGAPRVLFGDIDIPATIVGPPTPTQVVVEVPTGVIGSVPITVITEGGTVVSDAFFTVPGPAFDQDNPFDPNANPAGESVTLRGSNFDGPNLVVTFVAVTSGQEIVASVISVSADGTEIEVEVPSGFPSDTQVLITVRTDQGSTTSNDSFLVE